MGGRVSGGRVVDGGRWWSMMVRLVHQSLERCSHEVVEWYSGIVVWTHRRESDRDL